MQGISLYQDKKTILHRFDPLSKILYILTANLVPVILDSHFITAVFIVISILLLLVGKVFMKTLPMIAFSGLVLITVIIIQGIFHQDNATPVATIGSVVFYKEGLMFSLYIILNVVNILLSFAILVLTTKPSDMVEAFVRLGLPPKFGYVLGSVFQIIPQMMETMSKITDAQRSRGMEMEGNLLTRIKAFFPLISPVVMNSLINTRERAIALEVRGFSSSNKKTFLTEIKQTAADYAFKILWGIILFLAVAWRVNGWLQ